MDSSKLVVTITYQSSVIVKGIERKVAECGYKVSSVINEFDTIPAVAKDASLLITYLPGDITEDTVKSSRLAEICDMAIALEHNMLIIGEAKDYHDLLRLVPQLKRFIWVNRPLDMEKFKEMLRENEDSKPAPDTSEHKEAAPAVPEDPTNKKRILIVDDDPSYAKMVREWIRDSYRVDIVTAGMQAITFLVKVPENQKVDLILLDYEMPVVDGPQVLQMLRQEPATADIPVIFLTGLGTIDAVQRVMSLHPAGYVLKTTTREDLLKTLAEKL